VVGVPKGAHTELKHTLEPVVTIPLSAARQSLALAPPKEWRRRREVITDSLVLIQPCHRTKDGEVLARESQGTGFGSGVVKDERDRFAYAQNQQQKRKVKK
jgi:hypothetical protein